MNIAAAFLLAAVAFPLCAAPTLGSAVVTPATVVIGSPTQITVTSSIGDPLLISNSVNLVKLNSNGTTTVLGTMHDDGLNGDLYAGDGIFTILVTLNSQSVTQVQLQVSAAFKGVLQRVKSPSLSVFFQAVDAPEQSIRALAQNSATGNRAGMSNYVNPSTGADTIINTYSQQALTFLGSLLNSAVLVSSGPDSRTFQSPYTMPDGTVAKLEFDLVPGANGQWVINSW